MAFKCSQVRLVQMHGFQIVSGPASANAQFPNFPSDCTITKSARDEDGKAHLDWRDKQLKQLSCREL